jgi:hypothetical protein
MRNDLKFVHRVLVCWGNRLWKRSRPCVRNATRKTVRGFPKRPSRGRKSEPAVKPPGRDLQSPSSDGMGLSQSIHWVAPGALAMRVSSRSSALCFQTVLRLPNPQLSQGASRWTCRYDTCARVLARQRQVEHVGVAINDINRYTFGFPPRKYPSKPAPLLHQR